MNEDLLNRTAFVVAEQGPDGTRYYEPVAAPTGFIECRGEPMAFWLPAGVTPASINITAINGGAL